MKSFKGFVSKCYWTVSEKFCIQVVEIEKDIYYRVYDENGDFLQEFGTFAEADNFIAMNDVTK